MKALFKQLIIEFHARDLPHPSHRKMDIPELPPSMRKAFVFLGMRRTGKTWTLYQIMQELRFAGISQRQMLYLDFTDDRLLGMTGNDWQSLLDAYFELYPELTQESELYFFLDEVHEIPEWERFVRRVLDSEQIKLYLTGSSAKLLSKEISTRLRGRCITREIFPFSFAEYLDYKKFQIKSNMSLKEKASALHHLREYLRNGGFPETLNVSQPFHRELLQGYVDTVIYRDIAERHNVSNLLALKRFLVCCMQSSASLLSVNKIYNVFKSLGLSVSKNSLYEFLDYFEDVYCIFSVPVFEMSGRKSFLKPKKIYPVDTGLISAFTVKDGMEDGARFETAVFDHLRRMGNADVYYYVSESGREVDFVVREADGTLNLYQACLDLRDAGTREREMRALEEAMQALNVPVGYIITLEQAEDIKTGACLIRCLPAWRFLMGDLS